MSWFKKAFKRNRNRVNTAVVKPIKKQVIKPVGTMLTEMADKVLDTDNSNNCVVLTKRNNLIYYLWSGTRLDIRQQTYVVTHGWNSIAAGDNNFRTLIAAIKAYDSTANILFVDWTKYSNTLNYEIAVGSTFKVGLSIAIALLELGLNIKTTHLIGHSLGGHVMGITGTEYAQRTNRSVQTIIALDPVDPVFEYMGSNKRLDPTDAKRVIAFHSTDTLDYENALGSLDIYLNNWENDDQFGSCGLNTFKTSHNYPILCLSDLFRGHAFRQRDQALFTYHDLYTRSGSHHIDTHNRI
ncbi:MAG: hypothetical protein F6K11_23405 [Leptolyngbya sp. SIO3F4]|nr:hypothetical protein [Leptolyngbya sp. SIO3F4]